ncbi:MAG TPA: GNAT family N-acetyltransferase [Sulfuricurvum sp.]|nr:GNAT family N-acetyltransferase [Sulfuricurvum sp.]
MSMEAIAEDTEKPEDVRRLDLSGKALESLPESFGALTQLAVLNLANNALSTLPDSMYTCEMLSNLDLRRNRFETLPAVIGKLSLRSLNASGNHLKNAEVLTSCDSIRVLDLSSNSLESLSGAFSSENELRTVNVSCNYLTDLDDVFQSLENAERLNISGNAIKALGASVGSLEALEALEAGENQIADIDDAFFSLEVETIDLSSNQLRTLTLQGLESLEELILDNNPFDTLDIADDFAPYLREFSCDGCGLKQFLLPPSRFLEVLCYSSNAIEDVPESIAQYEKLAELDLEDNAITELPDALANLLLLQTLYVDGNPLSEKAKKIIEIKHPEICDLTMKRGTVIEEAKAEELAQMASLLELLFAIESDFTFDYDKQLNGITRLFDYEGSDLLVAKDGDKVVGMVTMQRLISSAAGDYIGQIEDLIVLEAYRKSGIGSRLINKIRFIAQSRGYKRIQLAADIDNDYALQFYTRRGFSRTHLAIFHFKNA